MNRGFPRVPVRAGIRPFLLFSVFLLSIAIQVFPAGREAPDPGPGSDSCEPRPPLDLDLEVTGFLPSPPGGIATIRVSLQPFTDLGGVTVTGRLRQEMQFLDGSTEKVWQIAVSRGTATEFTMEVLVPDDGMFVVVLEADGVTTSGRPVHRGRGVKIWSGIAPPQPRQRGKVLEFTGEPLP